MTLTEGPEALLWRENLVKAGFSDDGARLRGPVTWEHPQKGLTTARAEIEAENFPFAPPQVRILDPGVPLDLTFHVDRPAPGQILGNLCLWEDSWSADVAPWLEAQTVLDRIAHWLRRTALGWPGDRACDLERYLPRKDTLVLYDSAVPAHAQALGRRNLVETGNSYFGGTYITLERAYSRLMGHENRKFVLGFLLAGLNAYIERGWRIREIPQRRQPDSGQDRAETPAPKKRARRRHSTLAAVRKPEEEAPAHHGHTDKPAATRKRC